MGKPWTVGENPQLDLPAHFPLTPKPFQAGEGDKGTGPWFPLRATSCPAPSTGGKVGFRGRSLSPFEADPPSGRSALGQGRRHRPAAPLRNRAGWECPGFWGETWGQEEEGEQDQVLDYFCLALRDPALPALGPHTLSSCFCPLDGRLFHLQCLLPGLSPTEPHVVPQRIWSRGFTDQPNLKEENKKLGTCS